MGFESGLISFRRFAVVGNSQAVDEALLEKLSEHALRVPEMGLPEPVEYGFCGGRHVFDDAFNFERNVYDDALSIALRIDTSRVPAEISNAYKVIEEEAAAKENPSGFISKRQRQIAKETAQQRVDDDLRSGKFRRSKLVPMLWDVNNGVLYSNAAVKAQAAIIELFDRALGLSIEPLSAGTIGQRWLESAGKRREFEDLRPTRFVASPAGEEQSAEYPWCAKGAAGKDFLGNEFQLWLWYQAFSHEGAVRTDDGELTVFFDRLLDLDCAFGVSGRDMLRSAGVTRMPEALDALRSGKVPRKSGLLIDRAGDSFSLSLSAETFAVNALKLPEMKDAETPRVLFEQRIAVLRDFCKMLDGLYVAFLRVRTGGSWESTTTAIRKWIMHSTRAAAALA